MTEYPAHEIADRYPAIDDADLELIVEDMRRHGYRTEKPVYLFQGKVLDGRSRQKAAGVAGVEPVYAEFGGTYEEAEAFAESNNEARRHESAQVRQRLRQERVKRVAAARTQGKSLRTIAENESVSEKQVRLDLATDVQLRSPSAVEQTVHPEPAAHRDKAAGKDGKLRPITKPKPEEVAARRRLVASDLASEKTPTVRQLAAKHEVSVGTIDKDLKAIKEDPAAYSQPPAGAAGAAENPAATGRALRDELGFEVPPPLLDTFDRQLFDEVETAFKAIQKLLDRLAHSPAGILYRQRVTRTARGKKVTFSCPHLGNCLSTVRLCRPFLAVCPHCRQRKPSRDCHACSGLGFVTKESWERTNPEVRQALLDLLPKE